MKKQLLTSDDVALLFGITRQSVNNWIKGGKLPAVHIGRKRFVRRDDLEEYITNNRLDGTINWSLVDDQIQEYVAE